MRTRVKNKYSSSKNPYKKTWNGIPAFIKKNYLEASLSKSFATSLLWHIVGFLLLWLLTSALAFWGIMNVVFPTQKQKMPDIEFVLNNNSNSKAKSNNSQSLSNAKQISNSSNIEPKRQVKTSQKTDSAINQADITDTFSIPMPKIKPRSGAGWGARQTANPSGPDTSSISDGGAVNVGSQGNGSGGGNGFDKNATKKIIAAYDISPYVKELKRNIRWNWKAAKGADNNGVELFLRIAKDGRLIILNVKKTSEVADVDNAALNAVKHSEPLAPLPAQYKKGYLDVVFTFDNNISSIGSRY